MQGGRLLRQGLYPVPARMGAVAVGRIFCAQPQIAVPQRVDAHLARLAPIDVPVSIIRIGADRARGRRDLGRGVLLDCSTLDDLPRIIVAGGLA